MSFKGGASYSNNPNFKNPRRNAREQRLQFMNSQAELIAQKKREIEEKLAKQQQQQEEGAVKDSPVVPKVEVVVKQELVKETVEQHEDSKLPVKPLVFKNDGSFLEQFKQMQQQNPKPAVVSPPTVPASLDTSVPPPAPFYHNSYQYPPPQQYIKEEPQDTQHRSQYIKQEPGCSSQSSRFIKEESSRSSERSPSPYSPSRPCEDDDDLSPSVAQPPPPPQQPRPPAEPVFIVKDYHHEPVASSSSSVTESGMNFSQSVLGAKRKFEEPTKQEESKAMKERKRQSRWGPEPPVKVEPAAGPSHQQQHHHPVAVFPQNSMMSRITSADPQILTYAVRVFGTTDLTEDQWKQCMDQVKMQYVYQEMLKKKQERERLEEAGKVKYEYDSDEDTEGGTWEHKRRQAEMQKTKDWADQLTEKGRGKHHLGHFLPPEELAKFMEKFQAVREGRTVDDSDYKEFKIAESNVGYQMLKKFGWSEGEGLGLGGSGITAPVNAVRRNESHGLGTAKPDELTCEDNEYDAYRKRMMLAYRFRPNPLNNPRRSYY